jgi:hypothetical protein
MLLVKESYGCTGSVQEHISDLPAAEFVGNPNGAGFEDVGAMCAKAPKQDVLAIEKKASPFRHVSRVPIPK